MGVEAPHVARCFVDNNALQYLPDKYSHTHHDGDHVACEHGDNNTKLSKLQPHVPSIMKISVAVVEAHQHVLEHIHHVLRRRARKKGDISNAGTWSMIHFDSHPDLACPNETIPAVACFLPRKEWRREKSTTENDGEGVMLDEMNLYELLDTSQGGIAEWILPLVLAGDLDQTFWIKNKWCDQFQNGSYKFHVGAWNQGQTKKVQSFLDLPHEAVVRVSLLHPYYIDDNSFVSEDELILKEELELHVTEVNISSLSISAADQIEESYGIKSGCDTRKKDWVLDVCLDYFFCSNPFVDEMQDINADIANLFVKAVNETIFRKDMDSHQHQIDQVQADEYSNCFNDFNHIVCTLLKNLVSYVTNDQDFHNIDSLKSVGLREGAYHRLRNYYSSPSDAEQIWDNLIESILNWCRNEPFSIQNLVNIMLNALPNLRLPQAQKNSEGALSNSTLSPHLTMQIKQFGDYLRNRCWVCHPQKFRDEPMLITIARSADDGYTPEAIVEPLQKIVLDEIHSVYCGCGRWQNSEECKLNIIFDYGESEGATLL